MVCNGSATKLVQSHDTEDYHPSNQVPSGTTPNNPIQTVVIYQPPQTMDMPTNVKQTLQEVLNGVVKQIVPSDVDVVGVRNIP
jgi:hypothetical protein